MKHKNIFVACDTSNLSEIKKIIKQTQTNKLKVIPKFGLQFFYSRSGRKFLENFKKDFWLDKNFSDTNIQEASDFMSGRYSDCVEIPWKHVFISLLHNKNISNRITLGDEPNGCHFGWSDQLFLFITSLDSK